MNLGWFIALFAPAVIGPSYYFQIGISFMTLNWKPFYCITTDSFLYWKHTHKHEWVKDLKFKL